MIVNIHDGPWQCMEPRCEALYTRRPAACDNCGRTSFVKHNLRVAWGDDLTAECDKAGIVRELMRGEMDPRAKTLQDLQKEADVKAQAMLDTMARDQDRARAQAKPCQPDPFPMQQSAALSAILESWESVNGRVSLHDHLAIIQDHADALAMAATQLAMRMRDRGAKAPSLSQVGIP